MRIPKGMTRDEVDKVIDEVSSRFGRLSFGIYNKDDIKQEAALFCIDALDRYESGPLENFLMVHAKNRLLNLIRNESNNKNAKFLLNFTIPIQNIDEEMEPGMMYEDRTLLDLIGEELMTEINNRVPIERRIDLIKMLSGLKVSKTRRHAIIELVGDLFDDL